MVSGLVVGGKAASWFGWQSAVKRCSRSDWSQWGSIASGRANRVSLTARHLLLTWPRLLVVDWSPVGCRWPLIGRFKCQFKVNGPSRGLMTSMCRSASQYFTVITLLNVQLNYFHQPCGVMLCELRWRHLHFNICCATCASTWCFNGSCYNKLVNAHFIKTNIVLVYYHIPTSCYYSYCTHVPDGCTNIL